MIPQLVSWALIIACASVFVICDTLSAKWGQTGNANFLFLVLPLSPLGYLLFGYINRSNNLAINSGIVNSIIVISTISIGIFVFGDELSARQLVGVLFAVAAVLLVSY